MTVNTRNTWIGLVVATGILLLLSRFIALATGGPHLLLFLLVGAVVSCGLAANALLAAVVWPQALVRSQEVLTHRPFRCVLVGLLVVVAEGWVVVEGARGGGRGAAAVACLLLDLLWLAQGLPALSSLIGERLGCVRQPQAVAAGALLLAAGGVLPIVGWLLVLTLVVQALGAAVVGGLASNDATYTIAPARSSLYPSNVGMSSPPGAMV